MSLPAELWLPGEVGGAGKYGSRANWTCFVMAYAVGLSRIGLYRRRGSGRRLSNGNPDAFFNHFNFGSIKIRWRLRCLLCLAAAKWVCAGRAGGMTRVKGGWWPVLCKEGKELEFRRMADITAGGRWPNSLSYYTLWNKIQHHHCRGLSIRLIRWRRCWFTSYF